MYVCVGAWVATGTGAGTGGTPWVCARTEAGAGVQTCVCVKAWAATCAGTGIGAATWVWAKAEGVVWTCAGALTWGGVDIGV